MKRITWRVLGTVLTAGAAAGVMLAQTPAAQPQPFSVGNPVGLPMVAAPEATFNPVSSNVKVFGAIYSAESCSYDPARGVIVVPNRGVPQNVQTNNAWVSFINHDGSVHTARWLGIQKPGRARRADAAAGAERALRQRHRRTACSTWPTAMAAPRPTEPSVAVMRRFNMKTGAAGRRDPRREVPGFNDIEVADDGTIYATQTGTGGQTPDPAIVAGLEDHARTGPRRSSSRARRCASRTASPSTRRATSSCVNIGTDEVLTFSQDGQAAEDRARGAGRQRRPGDHAGRHEVREQRRRTAASRASGRASRRSSSRRTSRARRRCATTPGANQLVIPMNANNGLAFLPLK